MNAQQS